MRKVLMGSSAIALALSLGVPAVAAEWDVTLGGYMVQHVGYGSTDIKGVPSSAADFDGVDVLSDAEIHFLPSITLDNGIKFGANVQLEGNTSGDQIDESFMFVEGSFGEINLGSVDSAGYKMTYGAPSVSMMPVNSGSVSAFVPISGGGVVNGMDDLFLVPTGSTYVENAANEDSQRISYFSPRFAGFQVGISYARDAEQDTSVGGDNIAGGIGNFFDVGANFVESFGDIDVAVSGRYGFATNDAVGADDPEVFAFGANIGFAGVTVGGSWAEQNAAGDLDSQGFDVGISYATGPWSASFVYFRGEGVNNQCSTCVTASGASANDETYQAFSLGVTYDIAEGVAVGGYAVYAQVEEDDAVGYTGSEIDGFILGTAVRLSF